MGPLSFLDLHGINGVIMAKLKSDQGSVGVRGEGEGDPSAPKLRRGLNKHGLMMKGCGR